MYVTMIVNKCKKKRHLLYGAWKRMKTGFAEVHVSDNGFGDCDDGDGEILEGLMVH